MTVLDNFYYSTEERDSALECWEELGSYLKENADRYLVFMRSSPEVYSEYDIREQKTKYKGFVRFARGGQKVEEPNTFTFASL